MLHFLCCVRMLVRQCSSTAEHAMGGSRRALQAQTLPRKLICEGYPWRSHILLCAGANAMALSLMKGKRVTLSKVDAFADGVAVKQARHQSSASACEI